MSKTRRTQWFRPAYTEEFEFTRKLNKGTLYTLFTVCDNDINISYGGKSDIVQHTKSSKHHTCDFFREFFFPNSQIFANCLFTVFWKSAVFLRLFLGIPQIVFSLLKIPFIVERTV